MATESLPPRNTQALVSYGPYKTGGWKLSSVAVRPIRNDELLVEMVATGICQTDLHFAGMESGHGVHYPRVMGHEGAGYVRRVGSQTSIASVGDPVILSFASCKSCETCLRGHPSHCLRFDPINFQSDEDNLVFRDSLLTGPPTIYGQFFGQSSFSSWSIVHESSVVNMRGKVDSREELQLLSPLGCGIQTGTGAILNAANASANDRVAVLGLGGVGLSAIMGARIAGCAQIIGIDRHASRLELAKELGATHVVHTDGMADFQAITAAVREITGGLGTNITLDTTGVPGLIVQGVKMTGFKGKVLQVGTAPEKAVLDVPIHEFMVSGKSFMGVVEGDVIPGEFVPRMVDWVRSGQLPLAKIVRFYAPEEFEQAVVDMQEGRTIKPVLRWAARPGY